MDFSKCTQLTTIGKCAFFGCWSMPEIKLPSTITTIGDSAFSNCYELEAIYIDKPKDSISGAPWGASWAKVIWNG